MLKKTKKKTRRFTTDTDEELRKYVQCTLLSECNSKYAVLLDDCGQAAPKAEIIINFVNSTKNIEIFRGILVKKKKVTKKNKVYNI